MASRRTYVIGTGSVGESLIREASSHGHRITALEADVTRAERLARLRGVQAIHLRGFSLDELREAGLSKADVVLATSDDDEQNLRTITYALELGARRVGALASDEQHQEIFQRLGAQAVLIPARIVAERLCGLFLSSSVVYDLVLHDGSRIAQVLVNEESQFCGRCPTDPDLLEQGRWIVDVTRSGEHHQPSSIESVSPGDLVTVFFAHQPAASVALSTLLS